MTNYEKEFPDFGPLGVSIPEGFTDTSWHNDACPSFTSEAFKIWVDYANPDNREIPQSTRFTLCRVDAEGEYVSTVLASDNWADIVKALG